MTQVTVRRANRCAAGGVIALAMALATTAGCSDDQDDQDDRHEAWTLYTATFDDGRKTATGSLSFTVSGDSVTHTFEFHSVNSAGTATSRSATSRPAFSGISRTRIVETLDGKPLSLSNERTDQDEGTLIYGYTIDSNGKVRMTLSDRPPPERPSSDPSPGLGKDWPNGAIEVYGQRLLARKHGLAEGTSYTYKTFRGFGEVEEVDARVGKKVTVDMLGETMELTEVTRTVRGTSGKGHHRVPR